jgi:eukaryotic-like serine/threonine-protein kinase
MAHGTSELPVAIGDVVADKYRVERLIGRGGMGSVFQATHVQLLQRVALKFLSSAALRQEDARTRFLREARAAAALSSEHVARVIDVGVLPSDVPFLIIEYLEGEDLASRLERGPLPVEEAVKMIMQACDALGEAHRIGIVHRDIKPHNLFLMRRPNGAIALKVLDFGIAKVAHPELQSAEVITGTCAVMGTPQYMAPEQMASTRTVDAAADVWALGICLYECLTKRRPFESGNMLELGALVMNGSPTAITSHRGDLPHSLVAIIERCLSKDPTRRYPDANALHDALATAREKAAIVVAPPTLVTPHYVAHPTPGTPMPRPSTPPPMSPGGMTPAGTMHSPGGQGAMSTPVQTQTKPVPIPPRVSSPPAAPQLPTSTSFGESGDFRPPPPAPAPPSSRATTSIGLGLLAAVIAVAIGVKVLRKSGEPAPTANPDPPPAAVAPPPPATTTPATPTTEATPAPLPSLILLSAAPPSASSSTPPSTKAHHSSGGTTVKKTTPPPAPALTSAPPTR